MVLLHLK